MSLSDHTGLFVCVYFLVNKLVKKIMMKCNTAIRGFSGPNMGKYGQEKTPHLDTVPIMQIIW